MKRRNFFLKTSAGLLTALGLPNMLKAGTFRSDKPLKIDGNFIHVVYFWLKDPEDKYKNEQFLESQKDYLGKVEVIIDSFIGSPANTPRDVVDNSYTYSLILTFKNKEDQDVYQEHAAHQKFIEDSQHLWTKVQVYDSVPV